MFKIRDRKGRQIRLTEERWKHIAQEHPEMAACIEEMKEAMQHPTAIAEKTDDIAYYYRYIKEQRRYLLLIVKYLNGDGFVITAYFVRCMRGMVE